MKIYIVGIGPGNREQMTIGAIKAIENSDVIVGYNVYVDLVRDLLKNKKIISTPMKKEIERCEKTIEYALMGNTVSLICSGDSGVYGLAGLLYELVEKYQQNIDLEVIPGITAACSGAAVLGAPLIHDFAVISLSDLLTPIEKIEKRLSLASEADFVICLYNPRSKKRDTYLKNACNIMLNHKNINTPCGYIKNIGRSGEYNVLCTLGELRNNYKDVDMFTTIFIGNSQTFISNDKLITPRGYKI